MTQWYIQENNVHWSPLVGAFNRRGWLRLRMIKIFWKFSAWVEIKQKTCAQPHNMHHEGFNNTSLYTGHITAYEATWSHFSMKRQPTTLLTQRYLREQVNQPNDGFSFSTGEDHPWSLDLDGAKDSPSHQDVQDVGRPEVSEVPSAPSILPLQVAKTLQGNRQKLSSSTFFAVVLFNQKWYCGRTDALVPTVREVWDFVWSRNPWRHIGQSKWMGNCSYLVLKTTIRNMNGLCSDCQCLWFGISWENVQTLQPVATSLQWDIITKTLTIACSDNNIAPSMIEQWKQIWFPRSESPLPACGFHGSLPPQVKILSKHPNFGFQIIRP